MKNNKAEIRVVVANYNGARFLEESLGSILGSECPNFEVVVVDDGSVDESVKLVRKFEKVKLVRMKKNEGPARARNLGAKGFAGKYLVFLDVDTKLEKESLAEAREEMESERKLGAGQLDLVDHKGHFLTWSGMPYQASSFEKQIFGGITAALVVKKEVFEKIGGFDEDYEIYGEDTDLCWRVWLSGYKIKRLKAKATHVGKSSHDLRKIYGNGARNSWTSIIKNAESGLVVPMAFLNGVFWLSIGSYKLMRGRSKEAKWIFLGLLKGVAEGGKSITKRKLVLRAKNNQARRVMFGKMGIWELIKRGWRWGDEN